jgi:N-acetylglucosamine-6-phosphate deacetylase
MIYRIFFAFVFPTFFFASVTVFDHCDLAAKQAARRIADLIISKKGEKTVLGLATGATMIPVYLELKSIICQEKINLENVITFNLDEYLDLPISDAQSYHSFMHRYLFDDLFAYGLRLENIYIPDADSWEVYEEKIAELGPIDLQLLGIGRNGHIGFAEPGASPLSRTSVICLAETTRKDNAHFFGGNLGLVPRQAVTMGIATILDAKEILLLAFGSSKADAVREAIQGSISPQVPATFLQKHPRVDFYLDSKAAANLKPLKIRRFANAFLLRDHELVKGDLWTEGGKIVEPKDVADEEIDVQGRILAPGFIDLQINGAFGCDFSRDPEDIEQVALKLPQYGVTSFFPTIVSSSSDRYKYLISKLQPNRFDGKRACNMGVHIEGPFFCPKRIGAHSSKNLISQARSLDEVYGDLHGVQILTLAPELPGMAKIIKELKQKGVLVAAGHSSATYPEIQEAMKNGVRFATHLFNAMPPYHHREIGIIGAALISPKMPYTVIADGFHLSPETLAMSYKCNPEGLVLVTDAAEAMGLPAGIYQLGSTEIEASEEALYVKGTNTLAGSKLSMDKAVRRLCEYTKCSKIYALESASLKPAELSGFYPIKGTLSKGADADFVILSDDLQVEATYIGAELVWERELDRK